MHEDARGASLPPVDEAAALTTQNDDDEGSCSPAVEHVRHRRSLLPTMRISVASSSSSSAAETVEHRRSLLATEPVVVQSDAGDVDVGRTPRRRTVTFPRARLSSYARMGAEAERDEDHYPLSPQTEYPLSPQTHEVAQRREPRGFGRLLYETFSHTLRAWNPVRLNTTTPRGSRGSRKSQATESARESARAGEIDLADIAFCALDQLLGDQPEAGALLDISRATLTARGDDAWGSAGLEGSLEADEADEADADADAEVEVDEA